MGLQEAEQELELERRTREAWIVDSAPGAYALVVPVCTLCAVSEEACGKGVNPLGVWRQSGFLIWDPRVHACSLTGFLHSPQISGCRAPGLPRRTDTWILESWDAHVASVHRGAALPASFTLYFVNGCPLRSQLAPY